MPLPHRYDSSAHPSALDSEAVRAQGYNDENGLDSLKAVEETKADHASATHEPHVLKEAQDKLLSTDDRRGMMDLSGQDDTVFQGDKAVEIHEMTLCSHQELHRALSLESSPLLPPSPGKFVATPMPIGDQVPNLVALSPQTPGLEQVVKEQRDGGKSGEDDSQSEIQDILDQFNEKVSESGPVPSTGLVPNASSHPPRKSSLEPLGPGSPLQGSGNIIAASSSYFNDKPELDHTHGQQKLSKMLSVKSMDYPHQGRMGSSVAHGPSSPTSPPSLQKSLPPVPDPEPDLPFDFHRFLEQLRHRTADPVAKFLRSFLVEFGKKQWMVHEQVKIISDFLTFITGKMAQCEVWGEVSDAEFDNAREGMEKLVMNRLYAQTFSPAIPPPSLIPLAKGKRKTVEKASGPGRRGQHQEDVERDEILAQKVSIYGWVREEHLDITPVGNSGRRFLSLAQQELLKIKTYRAPRDKVICVLNCCKVIFGLLRNSKSADTSADSFVPLLILVVLQANPDHLVSNVQYILRFRNHDRLGGEAGYYLSSLMGAVQFIENMDRTALTVSDQDFEKHVEAAVSAIAERNQQEEVWMHRDVQTSEMGGIGPTPRNSVEVASGSDEIATDSFDGADERAVVSGLLRTIQRPLSNIGRIFSEDGGSTQSSGGLRVHELSAHPPETPRRLSPAVFQPPRSSTEQRSSGEESRVRSPRYSTEDAAARQASVEAAEAHRIHRAEHDNVVETLANMFPDLDRDLIDDVVRMKEGRVGLAVEACLALNT